MSSHLNYFLLMVVGLSLCGLLQHYSMIHSPLQNSRISPLAPPRPQSVDLATLPENQPLPLHDDHSAGIAAWGKGLTCLKAGFWGVNGRISSLPLLSPNALQLLYPQSLETCSLVA